MKDLYLVPNLGNGPAYVLDGHVRDYQAAVSYLEQQTFTLEQARAYLQLLVIQRVGDLPSQAR